MKSIYFWMFLLYLFCFDGMLIIMMLLFFMGNRMLFFGIKCYFYGICMCEMDYLEYIEKKCMLFLSNNLIKKLYYFLFIDFF